MKTMVRLGIMAIVLAIATPAYSASVSHIFRCEQYDETTEKALIAIVTKWVKAARTVDGGANIQASLHFPVAGTNGETDFAFVLSVPSASEWGTFADNYQGSAAQQLDVDWDELAVCPDSSLIRSIRIE